MAHYAFLDSDNIVTEVIVGRDENEIVDGISDWEAHYGAFRGQTCKRTSYNTYRDLEPVFGDASDPEKVTSWIDHGSKHRNGGTPFRGKYASIGDKYNAELDVFESPVAVEEPA